MSADDLTRRDFLRGGSLVTLTGLLGGVELVAQTETTPPAAAPAPLNRVKCAVIGCGVWGREIISTLTRIASAEIAAVCDTYPAFVKRANRLAPDAKPVEDYRQILADKTVPAVVVATPTHWHKAVVTEALQAGKHVYCEAPLAGTIEDARAIALAAQTSPKLHFQTGLQFRSDPQRPFVLNFIRSGATGKMVMARSQWHKKLSWRFTAPDPEREKEVNWRLDPQLSLGLIGEVGIHQLDCASWYLANRPTAVSGCGSLRLWTDGRTVPDTVQTSFEFPDGVRFQQDCTLANSFEGDYEAYYGSDAAILLRGSKAWMFKEVDAPALGWEVYAKKETFYQDTGIALLVGASKQQNLTEDPILEAAKPSPLQHALTNFLRTAGDLAAAAEDFTANFGADDPKALLEHLAKVPRQPGAGYQEGFESAVLAVKANEAVASGRRIEFKPEWFELT